MAITGTGPFTITGTESTLAIYNSVVAVDPANASKNSDDTAFDFNCNLYVGDGTTPTSWTSNDESVRIDASAFQVRANATLTVGTAAPARAGGYWRWQMSGDDQLEIIGTLRCYASRIYMGNRARANTGSTVYLEDCLVAALDSISNNEGADNPSITYKDCRVAGAAGVGVKLGGNISFSGTKISGSLYAIQPLSTNWAAATYTLNDVVGESNAYDIVSNQSSSPEINVVGFFDAAGDPRSSMLIGLTGPGVYGIQRLQWRYNLTSVAGGIAQSGTNVQIKSITGATALEASTSSGAIPQQVLTRLTYTASATGVASYPYTVKLRRYDLTSQQLTWQCDNHTVQQAVHLPVTVALSQAAAAAFSGISLAASGETSGTVTVSANCTASNLWDFYRNWISTFTNFGSDDTWSYDGSTINLGAWNLVVSGATLTGSATTTGSIYFVTTGTISGVYQSAAGTSGTLSISGLSSAAVYVQDGSGAFVDFSASVTGTYTRSIAPGGTGVWRWVAKRPGYEHSTGTFAPSGLISVAPPMPQKLNADGTAMYQGSTSLLVGVSFDGTASAFIDIGNGVAALQAVFDESEDALCTQQGMAWIGSGKDDLAQFNSSAGDFLFMTGGWRLRRASPGDANATVQAFAQSTDGTPVDEVNGTVRYLSSDSPQAIAAAVWASLSRTLTEGAPPTAAEITGAVWADPKADTLALESSVATVASAVWSDAKAGTLALESTAQVAADSAVLAASRSASILALPSPSSSEVATAVWANAKVDTLALQTTALDAANKAGTSVTNTEALLIKPSPSEAEISNAVWSNASVSNLADKSTLDLVALDASKARKLASNKVVVSNDGQLVTIYDDNNTSTLLQFNVTQDKMERTPL